MTDWRATAREVVGPLARRLVLAVALAVVVGLVLVLVNLVLVVRGADEVSLGRSALRLVGLAGVAPALAAWLTWQAGLLGAARVVARPAAAARGQGASAAQLAGIETELAQRLPALVPAPRWWPVLVVIGVNLAAWWLV